VARDKEEMRTRRPSARYEEERRRMRRLGTGEAGVEEKKRMEERRRGGGREDGGEEDERKRTWWWRDGGNVWTREEVDGDKGSGAPAISNFGGGEVISGGVEHHKA
jgi:hypothetical protein